MKFGTHVLPEVLNQIISSLLAQPTKKASYRDFSKKTYKMDNFWTPWDIRLIFGAHTCQVDMLYSQEFFLKSDDANRPNQPTS